MTIEELKDKFRPLVYPYIGSSFMTGTESPEVIEINTKECTKLSIQFAIEVLEDMVENADTNGYINENILKNEIQELKKYLDEK